ncbi:MAG: hypothetical protein EXR72_15250 [Myxococcales bacterium]|nr:hypothetical protein [Myxococcales bacterium]
MDRPPPAPSSTAPLLRGCAWAAGAAGLLSLGAGAGIWWWWDRAEEAALAAQAIAAAEAFAPARARLDADAGDDIDIDKTIRVLHQVDQSMRHQDDLHSFLASVAAADWRGVPREVLDARTRILDAQLSLYSRQTELDAQEATWTFTRDVVLTTLSVVAVQGEGGMVPDASFTVDRAAAERRLEELRAAEADRRSLIRDVDAKERALIEASIAYATVWAKWMEAYDRVSYHRDRAWMASARADWGETEREARAAIELAPHEREAHMLLARALLAQNTPESLGEAEALLAPFADGTSPGAMAPALLLRGTLREARGDAAGAADDFRHAALAYPTQAARLDDVLDPYRMRSSLRKSRAGAGIVESYSATMVGAGWFSPELHLARIAYDRGDADAGRAAVIDHFERRRAQRQWDYILTDLTWAESVLGEDFRAIFPEESWLDLKAEKSLFGVGTQLALEVNNRSDRPLKNAALVLCVRFTDMLTGDYVTFAGERTVPEVARHAKTSFGTIDVDTEVFGAPRTENDIVELRAILVTDDGVLWVDTEKHEAELLAAARERRRGAAPDREESARWSRVVDEAGRSASVRRDDGLVQDALEIELPAKLVWLRPRFTLRYGDATIEAATNVVDGDKIRLSFSGIGDLLSRGDPNRQADLVCESVFGNFVLSFAPAAGGGWTYLGYRSEG